MGVGQDSMCVGSNQWQTEVLCSADNTLDLKVFAWLAKQEAL